VAESHSRDLIADFAHQLRQPLSTLEALISYLELIIPVGDERAQEQLRSMHFEVGAVDQILAEGVRSLRALLANQPGSGAVDVLPLSEGETVEGLSCALTSPATASVTY
jgi:signal transduction histidine kinase